MFLSLILFDLKKKGLIKACLFLFWNVCLLTTYSLVFFKIIKNFFFGEKYKSRLPHFHILEG